MSESVVSINVYCQHFYSARRPGRTINRLLLFLCRSLESFKSVSGKSSLSLHSVFPNGKHNIMILLWMVASVWKMLLILVIIFNFRLVQMHREVYDFQSKRWEDVTTAVCHGLNTVLINSLWSWLCTIIDSLFRVNKRGKKKKKMNLLTQ